MIDVICRTERYAEIKACAVRRNRTPLDAIVEDRGASGQISTKKVGFRYAKPDIRTFFGDINRETESPAGAEEVPLINPKHEAGTFKR